MVPVVASHVLATIDPGMAMDLSDLLLKCISRGCRKTYECGVRSLQDFCNAKTLCSMPVDAITLCAIFWMMKKSMTCKVRSVLKYVSGIRAAHSMTATHGHYLITQLYHHCADEAIPDIRCGAMPG